MSEWVRVLHAHEAKRSALEAKCEKSTEDKKKHKAALERNLKEEKERHALYVQGIQDEVARMIKREEEVIKTATEELKEQKAKYG